MGFCVGGRTRLGSLTLPTAWIGPPTAMGAIPGDKPHGVLRELRAVSRRLDVGIAEQRYDRRADADTRQ